MKIKVLESKSVFLKPVVEEDANFILELRTNENLNKYLSPTNSSIENQRNWIKNYKLREKENKEFYFKVASKENEDLGFVRLYDIDYEKKELVFGSFILKETKPKLTALETMISVIKFAFDDLEMKKVKLDVRVKNEHAKNLYVRFGFEKTSENELDEFYELTREKFEKLYKKVYYSYKEN